MRTKVIAMSLAILFSLAFICFASDAAEGIAVGDSLHMVSFERLDKDPPLFIAKDSVVVSGKDIVNFSISATLTENRALKSIIVVVVSNQAFAATGEFEWIFPSGEQLNMYGKTVSKPGRDGLMDYTLTFLSGLSDLCACSLEAGDRNVLLRMYSKKGAAREFEIPSAFFTLLRSTAE